MFICAGSVDAGNFKGTGEIERLREHIASDTERYVERMKQLGFAEDTWSVRLLHNYVVFALQRKLFR